MTLHITRAMTVIRHLVPALVLLLTSAGPASAQAQTREQAQAEVAQRHEAVNTLDRTGDPVAWAVAQSELGASLHRLGDFDSVQGAIRAYRAALEALTQENEPAKWLEAQEGLGRALLDMARRRSFATAFGVSGAEIAPGLDASDAALAFTEVLRVRTRQGDRLGWARAQAGLGDALSLSALMQVFAASHTERIAALRAAAEVAYLEALDTFSPSEPLERASVNSSLSVLYESMATDFFDAYAEDEAALRRQDAERIRQIRRAIQAAQAAEREFQRAGQDDLAREVRERIRGLRERLRPNT